jgi:hypothetical protein
VVTAVHYDKRQNILGGDESRLKLVRGGGVAYFEVVSPVHPKELHTTVVFPCIAR